MTPDARIKEKLEALLRLAEDPSATKEERDLALERVLKIAEKYQVNAAHIDPHSGQYTREEITIHTFTVPTTYGIGPTRCTGIYRIVMAMGGDGYAQNRSSELVAYAPASAMNVLTVLIPSLLLQEINASTAYIDYLKTSHPGIRGLQEAARALRAAKADPREAQNRLNAEIRQRRKAFCLAFYVEAAEKIAVTRKDAVQEAGRGYEVVLVDTAARIEALISEVDGLRKQDARGQWYADGWEAGTTAGRQALIGQTEVHGGRLALEG